MPETSCETSADPSDVAGEDPSDATGEDPWRALDTLASPARVDDRAIELLGRFDVGDPRRVAGLVSWLVRRAGRDGSTVVHVDVVAAALRGLGVQDPAAGAERALEQGLVLAFTDEQVLGLPDAAGAEERVADALVGLVADGSVASGRDLSAADVVARAVTQPLTVLSVPRGDTRRELIRAVATAAAEQDARCVHVDAHLSEQPEVTAVDVVVVDGAERLRLDDAARLLERLAGGDLARLVLVGDEHELDGPTPGRFFGDVAESGVVPVCTLAHAAPTTPAAVLGASVRAGRLPVLDPSERAVVVTPAADPAQAVKRAAQLVSGSVTRVFEVAPRGTRVATLRTGGACGVAALAEAVQAAGADVRVGRVDEITAGSCEALVLVLPAESAGSLTRAALLSAAGCATRHLSVVHQAGPALADAVAHAPHAPRRTRLATLLQETLG